MFASKLVPSLLVAAATIFMTSATAEAAPKNKNATAIAGLVAAAAQVAAGDIQVVNVENVLRGVDIRFLNNALNNNEDFIDVEVIKNSRVLNNVLNDLDLDVNALNIVLADLVDIGAIDINVEDNTVELLENVVVAVNALGGTTIFVF